MSTQEEQRQALGELAAKALDEIDQMEGGAVLGDAVLVYEVRLSDDATQVRSSSIENSTPMAVGLLTLALKDLTTPAQSEDEELGP